MIEFLHGDYLRKQRVGLERFQRNCPNAQELMSSDSEYELRRLAAHKKFLEAIAKSQSDDQQLFLSHADAFVTTM